MLLSHQINAVPDLCCIVTRRLVESVGGVFWSCYQFSCSCMWARQWQTCSNTLFVSSNHFKMNSRELPLALGGQQAWHRLQSIQLVKSSVSHMKSMPLHFWASLSIMLNQKAGKRYQKFLSLIVGNQLSAWCMPSLSAASPHTPFAQVLHVLSWSCLGEMVP